MQTITKEARDAIAERDATLRAYCVAQGFTNKRTGWTSYKPEQVAHLNPPTNDERAQVEFFNFMHNKPARYFAYWRSNAETGQRPEITNWTGLVLARVTWRGDEYRDAFGGRRVNFRADGLNGVRYAGTFYKSSGDYVRMRAVRS